MLGYTCQLYFDFSGYSNMAVGLGMMLGFRFPQNFDSPYKSKNISEFWRRWHMTLSFFLRDYLFIPLGGSRGGKYLTLRNLVIVMFLGGLWHGAGWTFVIWGLYHGAMLAVHSTSKDWLKWQMPKLVRIAVTFIGVVIGWVIFRSTSMEMCGSVLGAMCGFNGIESDLVWGVTSKAGWAVLGGMLAIVFLAPNIWQLKFRPNLLYAVCLSCLFVLCVLRFDAESPFLYFQF